MTRKRRSAITPPASKLRQQVTVFSDLRHRRLNYSRLCPHGSFLPKFAAAHVASWIRASSCSGVLEDQKARGRVGYGDMVAAVNLGHLWMQDATHGQP